MILASSLLKILKYKPKLCTTYLATEAAKNIEHANCQEVNLTSLMLPLTGFTNLRLSETLPDGSAAPSDVVTRQLQVLQDLVKEASHPRLG